MTVTKIDNRNTKKQYAEDRENKEIQTAIATGKRAVKMFVNAIIRRQKAEYKEEYSNRDPFEKYQDMHYYLDKWLAEIKEFEILANPLINVPLVSVIVFPGKKLRVSNNIYVDFVGKYKLMIRILKLGIKHLKLVKKHEKIEVKKNEAL